MIDLVCFSLLVLFVMFKQLMQAVVQTASSCKKQAGSPEADREEISEL